MAYMSRNEFTAQEKIEALEDAKKEMTKYFKQWGSSLSVCTALRLSGASNYLRYYINFKLLKGDVYVTSWVIRKVYGNLTNAKNQTCEFNDLFWQKQYYLYRMRWVDHMINQIKEGQ